MPSPIDTYILRRIKLRRWKSERSHTQKEFAELVGISQNELSRMLNSTKNITDDRWEQIMTSLNIKDKTLPEDYENVKNELEQIKKETHDGRQLKDFLEREGIKKGDAAKKLGVSQTMVNHYMDARTLSRKIKQKINEKLSPDGQEIIKEPIHTPKALISVHKLPLVKESLRSVPDLRKLPVYEINFDTEDYNVEGAIVFVMETDMLEPTVKKDSELLAVEVPESKYKYHLGLTIIHYADRISIGQVTSNDLFDKGYITLHLGKESIVRVDGNDVQHLWQVVMGINKVKF